MDRKTIRDKILYCLDAKESTKEDIADDILAIFEGWKSPEECKAEFMIEFEAWAREGIHTCSYYPLGSEVEKCKFCGTVRTMKKGQ
jgi:hypothetical protein